MNPKVEAARGLRKGDLVNIQGMGLENIGQLVLKKDPQNTEGPSGGPDFLVYIKPSRSAQTLPITDDYVYASQCTIVLIKAKSVMLTEPVYKAHESQANASVIDIVARKPTTEDTEAAAIVLASKPTTEAACVLTKGAMAEG